MFEKVNPGHPDKVADRIAGAIVDLAYTKESDPRIAVEVLVGHNLCTVIAETSVILDRSEVLSIVNMSYYQGIELAMNAGVDMAIGDFVYEFDSIVDESEKQIIIDIYNKSLEGYDIVSATSGKNRTTFSTLFYKVFNKYSNTEYK